ncbi:hypothetical protein KKB18_09975, partial [bacterium]|nr:hypothetical protein [bacterium]
MIEKKFELNQKEIAEIMAVAGGFQKALILQVAVNNNLFTYLSKAKSGDIDTIARNFKWDRRSTRILLNALAAIGFLLKDGDFYKNTEKSEKYLVDGSEFYLGDIIKHNYNMLQNTWRKLDMVLKTGEPAVDRTIKKRDEDELRNFILGMANNTKVNINQLLSQVELSKFRNMLDLGGGP